MKITVNGHPRELDGPRAVGALVDREVADRRGVAVAVDGEMVPRAEWDDRELGDGMAVEILGAVQGG